MLVNLLKPIIDRFDESWSKYVKYIQWLHIQQMHNYCGVHVFYVHFTQYIVNAVMHSHILNVDTHVPSLYNLLHV